jgi:hypothetical protein
MATISHTISITLEFESTYYAKGHPGTYWDPPDPAEVDFKCLTLPEEAAQWVIENLTEEDRQEIENALIEAIEDRYSDDA